MLWTCSREGATFLHVTANGECQERRARNADLLRFSSSELSRRAHQSAQLPNHPLLHADH
jgi:hypothetical protein